MTALDLNTSQFAFPQRLARAARALLFVVASLPLGVIYLAALPIAALVGPAALGRMLELERALANGLLGAHIPAPPPVTPDASVERHQIAFLVAKLPVSACAAAFCALPAALFAELLGASGSRACRQQPLPWSVAAEARSPGSCCCCSQSPPSSCPSAPCVEPAR